MGWIGYYISKIFNYKMPKQQWGCVYRLTNIVTGKKYIGKTIQYTIRMKYHATKYSKCHYLRNSIKKYGWNNFRKDIIIKNVPEEDLNNIEKSYIEIENTIAPNGYNLTKGGEGCSGLVHTNEVKQRLSIINTGERHPQFGKKRAIDTCKKISKARRLKKKGSAWRTKSGKWKAYGPRYLGYKYLGLYATEKEARFIISIYLKKLEKEL